MSHIAECRRRVRDELSKVVVDPSELAEQLLIALLADGHCLLTGAPGVAKTLTVRSLARVLGLDFFHLRCSPDLYPEHVDAGLKTPNDAEVPCIAHVLLVDDMDRLPPRTTTLLYQAIEEGHMLIGGRVVPVPQPFLLLATRYPEEEQSPSPVFEPREDRFMLAIRVAYPDYRKEYRIAASMTEITGAEPAAVLSPEQILEMRQVASRVAVPPHAIHYALRLVRSTRVHEGENPDFIYEYVHRGAGPRAVHFVMLAAQMRASLHGRDTVRPDDVRAVLLPVLRHRIVTNRNARTTGVTPDQVITRLVENVPERLAGDDSPAGSDELIDPGQWTIDPWLS